MWIFWAICPCGTVSRRLKKNALIKNKGYILLLLNVAGLSSGGENNWEQF